MSESAFISRDTAVITGNYAAELLGQRLEAVRARLHKMNEYLPEDAAPWGWTLAGNELADVKEQYPQLSNRKSVTVITDRGLRELAKHIRTPEAAAIRRHPADRPLVIFQQMKRRVTPANELAMIAEIEELRRMTLHVSEQSKENGNRVLSDLGRTTLMPAGFATIETLAYNDPYFSDVEEARIIAEQCRVEMCSAHIQEDGKLIPVTAYNIAHYRRASARKAVEYGLM